MRAVRDCEILVRVAVENEYGDLIDADAVPTVTINDGAGTALVTNQPTTKERQGIYVYTLAKRTQLDQLDAAFTMAVSTNERIVHERIDVVERRLVSLRNLRRDKELASVSGPALLRLVDTTEEWIRAALGGIPPVREGFRVRMQASNGPLLRPAGYMLLGDLYAVTVDDVVWTAEQVADVVVTDGGYYLADDYWTATNWIELHGEYGYAPTLDLERAGAIMARYIARENDLPARATQVATEASTIIFSTPSPLRPTGLPEVDGIIGHYRDPLNL